MPNGHDDAEEIARLMRRVTKLKKRIAELERKATKVRCCFAGVGSACPIHEKRR